MSPFQLPQKFMQSGDCGCGSPSTGPYSPTSAVGAQVCNDAYYNLATSARLNIIGVGVGSKCQVRFVPLRGFVMDDGTGAGQFITNAPQVTMPAVNGGSVGAWTNAAQCPVLVSAVGTDPHTWRFLYAPTSGSYRLESENGNFKFVSASAIPGVDGVCQQATTVGRMRPFGCYTADATAEDPTWALRRLGLFDDSILAAYVDDDGNPWVKCLNPASEEFYYAGTIRAKKLQYITLESVDTDGAPITGGLEVLARGTVADAVIGYFSPTTKKFYRSPAHVRQVKSSDTNQALNLTTGYQNWPGHLIFDAATFNHPDVEITGTIVFSSQEQLLLGLFRDGVQIHTWNFDVNSQPNNSFAFNFIDINVPGGAHTYDLRGKVSTGTNATTMFYSCVTLKTLTQ